MKSLAPWLLTMLTLLPAWAIAAAPQPTGAAALGMFVGSWQGRGTFTAPDAKKPTHVQGANDCRWSSAEHVFLICDGVAHIEGVAVPQYQLSIYTYDAASGKYRFAGVTTNQEVASPDFSLKGNTWVYSGSFTDKAGKKHWFRTLNIFDAPTHYRYESQTSDDGQHWTTTGSGTNTRK